MSGSLFSRLERRFGDPAEQFTRRELLKAALAGSAGLLLSNSLTRAAAPRDTKRIVVVGAGFGGMAAAHELHAAGYDVMVVEARGRFGGRVHTTDRFINNKTVETGGEMIGLNHPTWIAYAQQLGLNLLPIPHDPSADAPIVLGGEALRHDKARELWKEMREGLARINGDAERIIDPYIPWKMAGAKDLDRRSTAAWIGKLAVSDFCKRAMTIDLTAINGVVPDQQSYLGNLAMVKGGGVEKYWTQTDALRCQDGNQQLPEEMSEDLGPAHFIFATPVKRIKIEEKRGVVTLADGQTLEADDVILAVPCSTWKEIVFDPPLPADLAPQMGFNTKFLTVLKTRFWEQGNLSPRSLTDGPISLTWEDTCNQPEEGGVCLTVYGGGPASEQAAEWAQEMREPNYLAALEKIYPKVRDQFVKSRFVNWRDDPLAQGSYSFPAPGEVTTIGPRLMDGLDRLHFAGEHCCYAFIGYMEGALQSGVRLAKKLAKRDGLIK
jgi:monoamine oxidase